MQATWRIGGGKGGGSTLRDRVYVLHTTLRVCYTKSPCRKLNRQCSITLPNWYLLVESTCIDVVVDAAVLAGQQHQIVDDAQVPSISEVAIPRRYFQQILRLKMKVRYLHRYNAVSGRTKFCFRKRTRVR